MRTPDNPSYWELSIDEKAASGAWEPDGPSGELHTDVAVIGAGVTGLMVAEALSGTDREVVMLEARDIAAATTGGSTAKVTALHGATYAELERRRGEATTGAYGRANQSAVDEFERVIERFGIDCGWERQPAFTYTSHPHKVDAIRREAEAAERAGLPVTLVTEVAAPFDVAAAVRCDDQAQLDPLRFALGVATGLRERGAKVFRRARVLKVEEGSPHVLRLDGATVTAESVILATQLPVHDPGLFFARTTPSRSYAIAARLSRPLPDGMYLGIDSPRRSIRHVSGNPLIGVFGGTAHQTGEGGTAHPDELEEWVSKTFDVVDVLARWSAQDRMPSDGIPFIGRMPQSAEGIHVATGFKKWGFTTSAVAAQCIRALIEGAPDPWGGVFDARRVPTSPHAVANAVGANAKVVGHFVGDRIRTMRPPPVGHLDPGQGGLVDVDGTKVAAYRDLDGSVRACSARCTHLGCLVSWNQAERSWDCACHGSRFSTTGEVLEGPAVAPLTPLNGTPGAG